MVSPWVTCLSILEFSKVVSLLPGFGDLTTRCLVVCACKCAFRVHGAPWVRNRGFYQPGSFPLTSSRAASAPPTLGRVWFHVFDNLSQRSLKRFSFAVVIFHPGRVPRWSWAVSSSLASSTVCSACSPLMHCGRSLEPSAGPSRYFLRHVS